MTIEASLLIVGLAAVAAAWDVARRKYTAVASSALAKRLEGVEARLAKNEERVSEVRSIATASKPLPSRITGASR